MKTDRNGFALPMILGILAVILIMLPALVNWVRQDTKMAVRDQKSALAFNLAEAAVDRGMWKLKSSTDTFEKASEGIATIAGYNFDTTYTDIPGGVYRIRFSSGPLTREATVLGEGKDLVTGQVRAIQAVYKNMSIPGAVLSGGNITWSDAFQAHWGPIMAQGNININDSGSAADYFPRKFSRQVVQSSISGYERDTNGINPPNTDNVEWWSDYSVPELPLLDFATLRSSANTTKTLNVYGCSEMTSGVVGTAWWGSHNCNISGSNHNGLKHFQNSWNHSLARKQYTWYWDGDVIMTGDVGDEGNGMWGYMIIRGSLTNWGGDNWPYTCTNCVPTNAWMEYAKITKTTVDTTATNQYPADNGYQNIKRTFKFGTDTWTGGPPSANTDIGFRGLLYVGGDFTIQGPADVHGAVWVNGNITKKTGIERTLVFFDETLELPILNVILVKQSWNEVMPSATAWP